MSKAPRHQGPQSRLCCGLLSSCPTQKASARSLRKTLVGCSPRCRCPHICVGGRTNRPCEPPNGYKRSTSKPSRVASSRPGSGSGCRCPMGSRPRCRRPIRGLKHLTKTVQTEAEYAETKARFLAVIAGAGEWAPFIANLATSIGRALTRSCDAARHLIACSPSSTGSTTRSLVYRPGRISRRPSQSSHDRDRGVRARLRATLAPDAEHGRHVMTRAYGEPRDFPIPTRWLDASSDLSRPDHGDQCAGAR